MKKNKVIIIICIIIIVICVGGYFALTYFLNKDLEKQEQELQETINKYGTVGKQNVNLFVAKFNTEIMDSGMEYPASDKYLVMEDGKYWYGMFEDISCYIMPIEFTGDKEKDIVEVIAIYVPKDSVNNEVAMKYFKNLIKASNNELTDEEVIYLMEEAIEQMPNKLKANNGKGISVSIADGGDHYEYQVTRLYK